jgi:hypothetical protein
VPALLTRSHDWDPADTTVQMLLTLQALPAAPGDALARALLQRMAAVQPRLIGLLTKQAEGSPHHLEEVVRRLIDDCDIQTDRPHRTLQTDRLDTLRLPTTLVGLLQARLEY